MIFIKLISGFSLLIIVTSIFSGASCAEISTCNNCRNGNFFHKVRLPNKEFNFEIERQDTFQLEVDRITGNYAKYSIKWLDNCTYEMYLKESTFPFSDSIKQVQRTIPLRVKILNCTDAYYVFNAQRNDLPVYSDTMWRAR